MKKDRNAFFESSQVTSSFMPNMMQPQMNVPMQQQMMPYQAATNTSSFYAGPNMPLNTYPSSYESNDLETKVSRLERQIQKLESRITKLEGATYTNNTNDPNMNTNMYMI